MTHLRRDDAWLSDLINLRYDLDFHLCNCPKVARPSGNSVKNGYANGSANVATTHGGEHDPVAQWQSGEESGIPDSSLGRRFDPAPGLKQG